MSVNDPIADLLTRIRNAHMATHASVSIPESKMKFSIVEILEQAGFIAGYKVESGTIIVDLKYHNGKPVISGLKRISKPGRRIYVGGKDIPSVQNGLGISVLSTSKGVLEGIAANHAGVGGELLCEIW